MVRSQLKTQEWEAKVFRRLPACEVRDAGRSPMQVRAGSTPRNRLSRHGVHIWSYCFVESTAIPQIPCQELAMVRRVNSLQSGFGSTRNINEEKSSWKSRAFSLHQAPLSRLSNGNVSGTISWTLSASEQSLRTEPKRASTK
jgi:hypothetical protein